MPAARSGADPEIGCFDAAGLGFDLEDHADLPGSLSRYAGGQAGPGAIREIYFSHRDVAGLERKWIWPILIPAAGGAIYFIEFAGSILDFEADHLVAPTAVLVEQGLLRVARIRERDFEGGAQGHSGPGRGRHRYGDEHGGSDSESDGDHHRWDDPIGS